jgi:hypothetical protein
VKKGGEAFFLIFLDVVPGMVLLFYSDLEAIFNIWKATGKGATAWPGAKGGEKGGCAFIEIVPCV